MSPNETMTIPTKSVFIITTTHRLVNQKRSQENLSMKISNNNRQLPTTIIHHKYPTSLRGRTENQVILSIANLVSLL